MTDWDALPDDGATPPDREPAEPDADEPAGEKIGRGPLACPECAAAGIDRRFMLAMHLGAHRRQAHGVEGTSKTKDKRPRGRAASQGGGGGGGRTAPGSQGRRAELVRETLLELVDTADQLRGRGQPQPADLADTIRRDADRIAVSLAGLSVRVVPLGVLIDRTFGTGGPLSLIRAFGPTLRQLVGRWQEKAAEREREAAMTIDGQAYVLPGEPVAPSAYPEGFAEPVPPPAAPWQADDAPSGY